jgi:hypothetical protein
MRGEVERSVKKVVKSSRLRVAVGVDQKDLRKIS